MNEKLDAGEILMQGSFDITLNMTGGSLKTKTCKVAEIMVGQLLGDLEEDNIIPVKQDESKAVYDRWEEDLRFVEKYLNEIDVRIKNEILTQEYKKGNDAEADFALSHIDAVNKFLKQGLDEKSSFEDTVSQLLKIVK